MSNYKVNDYIAIEEQFKSFLDVNQEEISEFVVNEEATIKDPEILAKAKEALAKALEGSGYSINEKDVEEALGLAVDENPEGKDFDNLSAKGAELADEEDDSVDISDDEDEDDSVDISDEGEPKEDEEPIPPDLSGAESEAEHEKMFDTFVKAIDNGKSINNFENSLKQMLISKGTTLDTLINDGLSQYGKGFFGNDNQALNNAKMVVIDSMMMLFYMSMVRSKIESISKEKLTAESVFNEGLFANIKNKMGTAIKKTFSSNFASKNAVSMEEVAKVYKKYLDNFLSDKIRIKNAATAINAAKIPTVGQITKGEIDLIQKLGIWRSGPEKNKKVLESAKFNDEFKKLFNKAIIKKIAEKAGQAFALNAKKGQGKRDELELDADED